MPPLPRRGADFKPDPEVCSRRQDRHYATDPLGRIVELGIIDRFFLEQWQAFGGSQNKGVAATLRVLLDTVVVGGRGGVFRACKRA